MASPTWVTLADLKSDQVLDGQLTTRDDVALQRTLDAAMVWVQAHRPDLDYHGAWSVPADVRLGTIRLAARWFVRRVVAPNVRFTSGSVSMIEMMRADPDIYMLLGIVGGLA